MASRALAPSWRIFLGFLGQFSRIAQVKIGSIILCSVCPASPCPLRSAEAICMASRCKLTWICKRIRAASRWGLLPPLAMAKSSSSCFPAMSSCALACNGNKRFASAVLSESFLRASVVYFAMACHTAAFVASCSVCAKAIKGGSPLIWPCQANNFATAKRTLISLSSSLGVNCCINSGVQPK